MEQEEAQADGLNLVPILLCVNAHHHPPEGITAGDKPLESGRLNDVVRRLRKRSRLSIE